MNQEEMDQGWQRIQSNIDELVNKYLCSDDSAHSRKRGDGVCISLPPDYKTDRMKSRSKGEI